MRSSAARPWVRAFRLLVPPPPPPPHPKRAAAARPAGRKRAMNALDALDAVIARLLSREERNEERYCEQRFGGGGRSYVVAADKIETGTRVPEYAMRTGCLRLAHGLQTEAELVYNLAIRPVRGWDRRAELPGNRY